jgi:hypothetical protein
MKAKKSVYQSGGKMPVGAKKKMTDMEIAKANRMQMLTEERNTIRKYDPDALAAFDRDLKTKGYMVNKKPTKKMSEGGKMDTYGMGGKMKKYLAGGQVKLDKNKDGKISGEDFKMMKKYQMGGQMPVEKKDSFVGKGLYPKDPTAKGGPTELEILEQLTWDKSVEALKRRGVSMADQAPASKKILGQGNRNILDNNYELALKKAKEYGVYDEARQEAVKEYRSKKPSAGGQK